MMLPLSHLRQPMGGSRKTDVRTDRIATVDQCRASALVCLLSIIMAHNSERTTQCWLLYVNLSNVWANAFTLRLIHLRCVQKFHNLEYIFYSWKSLAMKFSMRWMFLAIKRTYLICHLTLDMFLHYLPLHTDRKVQVFVQHTSLQPKRLSPKHVVAQTSVALTSCRPNDRRPLCLV